MKTLVCLICKTPHLVDGFLFHIYEHLNYHRYQCTQCSFSCLKDEESVMHAFDTNHAVQRKDDNYCEELAKNIFRDCLESATKDPVVSSSAETETGVTSCLERKNKDFLPSSSGCEKISSEVVNSCDSSVSTCINTATTVKSNEEKLKCPDTSITPIFPSSFHRQLIPHKRTKVKRTVRTAINDTSRPKKVVRHSKSKRSPNDEKCLFPGDADSPSPESSYCSAEPSLLAACQKKDSLESAGSVLKDTKLTNSGPVSYSVSDSCGLQLLMISSICKTPASRILSSPDLIEKRSREEFDLCGGGNKDVCNHSQPTAAVRAPESPTSHPSVDNDDRRRNESNCGQSMPKDLSEVVESLLQNSTRTMTSCHKCGMSVDSSYLVRKFHAMQYHFNAVDSDPEAFLLLPAAVKECFPSFLASSDLECNECGKKYATERGRRAHVLSEHFHEMFVCVAMDCSFIVSTPMQLKKHLKEVHRLNICNANSCDEETYDRFIDMKRKFVKEFARRLRLCFPCPIPIREDSAVTSLLDHHLLPKTSVTDRVASLKTMIFPPKLTENRKINEQDSVSSDSSDSDDSVICINDISTHSNSPKRNGLSMNKDHISAVTEGNEMRLSASSHYRDGEGTTSSTIMCLDIRRNAFLLCKLCSNQVAKEDMASHAWSHYSGFTSGPGPFFCQACMWRAFCIPDVLKHINEKHSGAGVAVGSSLQSHDSWGLLMKTAECFPVEKFN